MSGEEIPRVGGGHEAHSDCAPIPDQVKEVLEKGLFCIVLVLII